MAGRAPMLCCILQPCGIGFMHPWNQGRHERPQAGSWTRRPRQRRRQERRRPAPGLQAFAGLAGHRMILPESLPARRAGSRQPGGSSRGAPGPAPRPQASRAPQRRSRHSASTLQLTIESPCVRRPPHSAPACRRRWRTWRPAVSAATMSAAPANVGGDRWSALARGLPFLQSTRPMQRALGCPGTGIVVRQPCATDQARAAALGGPYGVGTPPPQL